ncbi:MAG: hypothetical protein IIA89_12310, partial [Chloroflexi bacterium]|nr:hypothetical protein [Chloroflexota bacterium]
MARNTQGLRVAALSEGQKSLVSYVLPAALVTGLILVLISLQASAESSVAG